jgi:hypothetical protein
MSLWTPSGEHPVGRDRPDEHPKGGVEGRVEGSPTERAAPGAGQGPGVPGRGHDESDAAGADAEVEALRRQLAEAPAEVVVANHCYGLFELAAMYLSGSPPHLGDARLAIDALGFLVDGLGERLGEAHASLRDALAQIRLAFVQIAAAQEASPGDGTSSS